MSEWMRVSESCAGLLAGAGLVTFDDWMNVACEREKPTGREESLTLFDLDGDDGFRVYLKRYRPRRPTLRFFLRRSRQWCESENAALLRALGMGTAEPVVVGERRRFGRVTAAFVATREVVGARSLAEFVPALSRTSSRESRRVLRRLIEELAPIVRRMHDAHYVYFDLYWRNVLAREKAGGSHEFFMIDSPRGRRAWFRCRRGKVRDLATLDRDARKYLSKTDRLRFVRAYLGCGRLGTRERRLCENVVRRNPPGTSGNSA